VCVWFGPEEGGGVEAIGGGPGNVGHGGNGDDVADADAVLSVALTVATR